MKKEKVIVTGANGMLGSNICRELIKQNYNVKAFCLPSEKINTIADLPLEISYGDILNKKEIQASDFEQSLNGCLLKPAACKKFSKI